MFIWLGRRRPVSVERLVSWHVITDLIDSSASFDITDNGAREIMTLGKSELLGLLIFFPQKCSALSVFVKLMA